MRDESIKGVLAVQFDPRGFAVLWNGFTLLEQLGSPAALFDMSLPRCRWDWDAMRLQDVDLGGCYRDRHPQDEPAGWDDGSDQPELTEDELEEARCEDDRRELDEEAHRRP